MSHYSIALLSPDRRIERIGLPNELPPYKPSMAVALLHQPEPEFDPQTHTCVLAEMIGVLVEPEVTELPWEWVVSEIPLPPVPEEVTRRQLFLWVYNTLSLTRDQIRATIEDEAGLIEFDEALTFRRSHPLVESLGAAFSLSSAQLDQAFRDASQL